MAPVASPFAVASNVHQNQQYDQNPVIPVDVRESIPPCSLLKGRDVPAKSAPAFALASVIGRRGRMEDAFFIRRPLSGSRLHAFGVFDGHGGVTAAKHCADNLGRYLEAHLEQLGQLDDDSITNGVTSVTGVTGVINSEQLETRARNSSPPDVGAAITRALLQADAEVCSASSRVSCDLSCGDLSCDLSCDPCCGTTALVGVVGPRHVWLAHVGDSRAIICRDGAAMPLTVDHKPNAPAERARIEAAGGYLQYIPRQNAFLTMGTLAMSRAIGDANLRPYVVPDPECTCVARNAADEFLVLASDGLWDVLGNQDVADRVRAGLAKRLATSPDLATACAASATALVNEAYSRGSSDNITAIVVHLGGP